MSPSLLLLARLLSLGWFPVLAVVAWTLRCVRILPRARVLSEGEYPSLTLIVAARNEAAALRRHLPALTSCRYRGPLQIIVADDRSVDETPAVLDHFPTLDRVRIDNLPAGWLGKCHALHCASQRARGEWLLFLDADVALSPGALDRAVSAAVRRHLDHLPCCPRLRLESVWEQLFMVYFHIAFCFRFLPGHVHLPTSKIHVGVGAFNLIRRAAYEAIGGHEGLRLEVVDDMEMGRRIKQAGLKQAFYAGYEDVQVRWFEGFEGLFRGLEKNAFAGQGYSLPLATGVVVLTTLVSLAPVWLMARGDVIGWLAWVTFALFAARQQACLGIKSWACPLWPVGGLLVAAVTAFSTWRTLRQGGIRWRETFYSLTELRP